MNNLIDFCPFFHLLIHSTAVLFIPIFALLLIRSLIDWLIYAFFHLLIHSTAVLFIPIFALLLIRSLIDWLIYAFFHLFTISLIYQIIYSPCCLLYISCSSFVTIIFLPSSIIHNVLHLFVDLILTFYFLQLIALQTGLISHCAIPFRFRL